MQNRIKYKLGIFFHCCQIKVKISNSSPILQTFCQICGKFSNNLAKLWKNLNKDRKIQKTCKGRGS